MIGSCLMMALKGPQLLKKEKDFIIKNQIAGVILFQRNIESLDQLFQLNKEIKSLSLLPPLIAIDMEGGLVNRLSHFKEFENWPSAESLSQFSSQKIFLIAKKQARQLKNLGIDLNFAPVVDLPLVESTVLRSRAFGKSSHDILRAVEPLLKGFNEEGLLFCLKHFPGHGGVLEDSHEVLPKDSRSLKDLAEQLEIFHKLFKSYSSCVMTAHVEFPNIEKGPATFSKKILTKLLKKELGFKNLIVSDDIDMKALKNFSAGESFFSALKAGCDLVITCQNQESPFEIIKYFKNHPQKKEEIKKELSRAFQKLLQIKKSLKT